MRIQIYNPITKLVVKNLSRFRENAYGGSFRSDGKLLCAGSEEKNVKLFDVSSKSLLRLFKGHGAPVHKTFFLFNKPQIASFSDDKLVKIWDIPTEKQLICYSGHNDYVRAGALCPAAPEIVLSGSYDNSINMYDTRSEKAVLSVNHGSPIESLIYLPSGGIFLSAGGTSIKIWDVIGGGKLLGNISQHHKTITCMQLASDNKRLLSGSLDRHVKIYDMNTFKVVHSLDYPNAVLSIGVSKTDNTIVAGLVDGLISISRREEERIVKAPANNVFSYKYLSRFRKTNLDEFIMERVKEKQSKIDYCLRKFQYSKALDNALLPYITNKSPQITVSTMQELIRRRALDRAFKGKDFKSLLQILRFLYRNITDYRFTRTLVDVFNIFLDAYEDSIETMPTEIKTILQTISKLLQQEILLGNELAALQGTMNMLLSISLDSNYQIALFKNEPRHLTPSEDAQKNFIVNLT